MLISIILPCYNEEDNLNELYSRLRTVMKSVGEPYELIFIDDGSSDNTLNKLKGFCETEKQCRIFEFSRNFGHQQAISAGLDNAQGDAVIMMDADLQHPPELIPKLIEKWKEGYEIVYTIRKDPPGTSLFKKMTARIFYKLINTLANIDIPENSADFRLLDKKVVEQLRLLKEKTKFFRGLISWVGFNKCAVYYEASPRYAGRSKYTVWKMIKFAYDGITSFSAFPLHIATALGVVVSLFSFLYAVYAIYARLFTNQTLPGWTSVLVAVLFLGGVQLISLGLIGGYIGKAYDELKQRPSYIIRDVIDQSSTLNPNEKKSEKVRGSKQ
jgi:glycosyltransferase involved in cell wall biosynthesis